MTGDVRPDAVTDPAWEDQLRAGLEGDGGAGSVEPELAVARLLLHARAPAELTAAREDAIWQQLDGALAPLPWWRRRAVLWGGPLLAAAAAVVVMFVVRPPGRAPGSGGGAALAEQLEQQFAVLAPDARDALARRVDASRGSMRGELIAMARGSGGTQGGAP